LFTPAHTRGFIVVNVILVFMAHAAALGSSAPSDDPLSKKDKGSVCLGVYAPKIIQDNELKRVYLTVGQSDKIFFDQKPGAKVFDNLDLHKTYLVRVFYDSRQVDSWKLRFDRLGVNVVTIWRSGGYWHMDPNPSGQCVWPPHSR
jgi:hypothetical protein